MSFPTSIPSYAGFTSGHTLQADNHAAQHNSEQTDITALGTKVGTGSATPANNTVLRGNGAGTSTWGQVNLTTDATGTLPTSLGGTGTTSTTGTGSVVFATSPTISGATLSGQPTITDFTNATHGHTNAAGGGTLGTSALQANAVQGNQLATNAISLGYTSITSNFNTTTTPGYADVTSLTVTVTVPAGGRDLELTAFASGIQTTAAAGTAVNWTIAEGATVLGQSTVSIPVTSYNIPALCIARVPAPTPGSHTYKVSVAQSGAGTLTVLAGATGSAGGNGSPAFILAKLI